MKTVALLTICGMAACAHAQYRSIDGTGNNLLSPQMGCVGSELIRGASGAYYADGIGQPIAGPNVRTISNLLGAQTPAGLGNARNLSSWAWQWGQFIDHDFTLIDEGAEAMNIAIPTGDPVFDPMGTGTAVMPFHRSAFTQGVTTPRQHANAITHWIDGSNVYGSDTTRATALREGVGGRLATSTGDMMPYNTGGLPNAGGPSPTMHLGGDIRANEQTGLLATHTLFVREHNRIAGLIGAANPGMGDEEIYQRARRMVGAEIQAITYNEWLPAMLGGHGLGSYAGYNDQTDASIDTNFSTAAFRIGHTMLNDQLLRVEHGGAAYAGGHLSLFQSFFNPSVLAEPGSFDAVLRGLAYQEANEVDTQMIDGVRNLLFGGTSGRDLLALNLQRGRDHGIPDYNTLREDYGLAAVTSFDQITSDPALAAALEAAYGDVDAIDAWIGLFAEDHLAGASMGQTSAAIFRDQFGRLREGDRFFYLNDPNLSPEELAFLADLRLGDIIALNTGITDLSGGSVFFTVPTPGAMGVLAMAGGLSARRRRR
ncbi:MAG: peroxidase family protein [Phycisphaerales bacterium]